MQFTSVFSQLLDSTTNSYKHLFLQAVVSRAASGQKIICLNELTVDMLEIAWYPSQYFRLSFGLQDQVATVFNKCDFTISNRNSITSTSFKKNLRNEIIKSIDISAIQKLTRYVPYRLLSPFFHQQLSGKKDGVKNSLIEKLADSEFNNCCPLYRMHDNNTIELHPNWSMYISENIAVLKDYLKLNWAAYLQVNNPNVPAILDKTEPPIKRASLTKQTNYWQHFLDLYPNERCIYTNEVLSQVKLSIDHFLPWSFVCHDRLWNLIPVNSKSNSSKSNNLPALDKYLTPFIEQQHKAISTHAVMSNNWRKYGDIYLQDIGLRSYQQLLDEEIFEKKLSQTIQIQHNLARQIGFKYGWTL